MTVCLLADSESPFASVAGSQSAALETLPKSYFVDSGTRSFVLSKGPNLTALVEVVELLEAMPRSGEY